MMPGFEMLKFDVQIKPLLIFEEANFLKGVTRNE